MLTYGNDSKRQAFRAAIERARDEGIHPAEMVSMIIAVENETQPTNGAHSFEPDSVIYEPGELPEGLIDLPSASKKYGIPVRTLGAWVRRGKLPKRGRLRARSPGGGYIVTVEAMIPYCRDNPLKTGRKKRVVS